MSQLQPAYSHSHTTNGIKVSVITEYQAEFSNVMQAHFVFAYKISIENNSPYTVQLLHRHWYIHDIDTLPREVEGEGVVGKKPILEAGESYQYVSSCHLRGGIGKMKGFYTMEKTVDGKTFEVIIPEFVMIVPSLYN